MATSRHPNRGHEVIPLELFFDLVFVFAVSQLSHYLLAHLSWRGAAQTSVMLVGVFAVWSYTSFEATLFAHRPGHVRVMMLLVMVIGLFMNAAITNAFAQSAFAFVGPMLLIQLGRTLLSTIPESPNSTLRRHYRRMLAWILITTPLWVVGAMVPPPARLLWWAAAAGIDLVGTWLAHPWPGEKLDSRNMDFDSAHMLERVRLFLIIALGEVVLTAGAAIAHASPELLTYVTGACAIVVLIALWGLYFSGSDHFVDRHAHRTSDPILASRLALNGECLVVGGLIALAVAMELAITHPTHPLSPLTATLLAAGPAAYLAVQIWFLHFVTGRLPRSRVVAAVALVPLAIAAANLPATLTLGLLAGLLVVLWGVVERENRAEHA